MWLCRWVIPALSLVLIGCGPGVGTDTTPAFPDHPLRVVSLDYCADQYVLKLLEPSRILALSPDATSDFSYMRAAAKGLPTVRPQAEDVLLARPDLVIRSYGGGPGIGALLGRAGIPVLQVGYADDLDGVARVMLEVADGLGESQRGQAVVDQMNSRLAALATQGHRGQALYMTPAGVTSGPGTLVDRMLAAAGFDNYQPRPGWNSLPLEQMVYRHPDLVAAAFFDIKTNHNGSWSASRHPVARRALEQTPAVMLNGAWTACGSWFIVDAIEALAGAKP